MNLIQQITTTLERGKKILADNPDVTSLSMELSGHSVKDVEDAAAHFSRTIDYMKVSNTFAFCVIADQDNHHVFVHVHSVEVKVKAVY